MTTLNDNSAAEYRDIGKARRDPPHPILESRKGEKFWWEENGIFNAGAAEYRGKIMLLYRAYDRFHVSRFGLAESTDGINFSVLDLPVVDTDPDDPHERLGIEDPRITKIDNTYYILHTSSSYHRVDRPPNVGGVMEHIPWRVRVGLRTTQDFRQFQKYGIIIPDAPAKNACLLPEKINGMFALFYREHSHPNGEETELLKFALTPDFLSWDTIRTISWPHPREWQQSKFGLGSQPISVPGGFLMVYHAIDADSVYRLGLMMLDREDPTRIKWLSNPILEPEMPYEKEGYVANVVYTCGAIIRGEELWIYYGAADRVLGRAVMPLSAILAP